MDILIWRIVKYLAFAVWSYGLLSALTLPKATQRQRAAYLLAVPGFVAVCVAGYGMMKTLGYPLRTHWILAAFVAGAVAVGGAIQTAEHKLFGVAGAGLALGWLAAAVALMVTREAATPLLIAAPCLVGAAAGVALALRLKEHDADPRLAHSWFKWLARVEGSTLVLMVCINMPLRKLTGIELDGGDGWIGWVHGVAALLFIPALLSAYWAAPLTLPKAALGFVASLLPFGTFAFEKWVLPDPE